jgi:predicted TIM-barrel enzyme
LLLCWPRQTNTACQSLAKIIAISLAKMPALVVKSVLTLVPRVKQDHMFAAVLAKEPRQTIFQLLKLLKLGKYYSKVIIKNVSSSCQRWSYLGSLG